jgi:hypothetical protein
MIRTRYVLCFAVSWFVLAAMATPAIADDVEYYPGTTYKIVQLTGDVDVTRRIDTKTKINTNFGVYATDLGSTFEHNGKLYFLFGDTPSLGSVDREAPDFRPDFLAWTTHVKPEDVELKVRCRSSEDSRARPITIPNARLQVTLTGDGGPAVIGR